jgi:hypothetical protein
VLRRAIALSCRRKTAQVTTQAAKIITSHLTITTAIAKKAQAAFTAVTKVHGLDVGGWVKHEKQIPNHYYKDDNHLVEEYATVPSPEKGCVGWEVLDIENMCEGHTLFIETEFTDLWTGTLTQSS